MTANEKLRFDVFKVAGLVVCPMCDEKRCNGRINCGEFNAWVDRKVQEIIASEA